MLVCNQFELLFITMFLCFPTTQTHQQLVPRRSPEREDGRTARFKRILVARVGEVRSDDDQVVDLILIPRLLCNDPLYQAKH